MCKTPYKIFIFFMIQANQSNKKALHPEKPGTKGNPSAVPPAFVYSTRTLAPVTWRSSVPVSRAAPGRTKRHTSRRLAAGDRPSLRCANSLFSRSKHLNTYIFIAYPAAECKRKISKIYKKGSGIWCRIALKLFYREENL